MAWLQVPDETAALPAWFVPKAKERGEFVIEEQHALQPTGSREPRCVFGLEHLPTCNCELSAADAALQTASRNFVNLIGRHQRQAASLCGVQETQCEGMLRVLL